VLQIRIILFAFSYKTRTKNCILYIKKKKKVSSSLQDKHFNLSPAVFPFGDKYFVERGNLRNVFCKQFGRLNPGGRGRLHARLAP
jgi:hypothetical protein